MPKWPPQILKMLTLTELHRDSFWRELLEKPEECQCFEVKVNKSDVQPFLDWLGECDIDSFYELERCKKALQYLMDRADPSDIVEVQKILRDTG